MSLLPSKNDYENINNLQTQLMQELHLIRLNIDLMILNAELLNYQVIHANEKSSIFTKVTYGVKNEFNNIKSEKLNKDKEIVEQRIKEISDKTVDYDETIELIEKTFKDDEYGISRYLFSLTFVNDVKEYLYEEISLKTVSTMLYKDETILKKIKNDFKDTYIKIGSQSLSTTQKYAIGVAAGLALASAVIVAPVVLASISLPLTLSSFTIYTITGVSLTTSVTYSAMKINNRTDIKNDFKKLNYEEITYILALKSLLLDYSYKTLEKDKFKEYLNDVLLLTSDLKADSLYYALVENNDLEKNQKLTDAYYRFDKQMLKKFK